MGTEYIKDSRSPYIGELNRRIAVMEITQGKSPTSGAILEYESLIKNCWSKVEDVSVKEELEGKIAAYNTKVFTIRFDKRCYGSGATDKLIRYEGEKYEILSVLMIGNKEYLRIQAVHRE